MLYGPYRRLGTVLRTNLSHHVLEVHLNCRLGDIQIARNRLVGLPTKQATENLDLSLGKFIA